MKHFCAKKGYGVCCVRRGLDCCHFPAEKGLYPCMVIECDSKSKFHHFLVPRHVLGLIMPITAKKGGVKIHPQGLGAWACLLGKNCAFLETLETRFLATTWVWKSFSTLPGHALSNVMV